jgi:hypothetical protein
MSISRAGAGAAPYTPAHLQAPRDPGYAALDRDVQDASAPGSAAWRRSTGCGRASRRRRSRRCSTGPRGWCTGHSGRVHVTEIPGVIAAGQRWKLEWQVDGNNADGILADTDGALLLAQNDNGAIVKLMNGKVTRCSAISIPAVRYREIPKARPSSSNVACTTTYGS